MESQLLNVVEKAKYKQNVVMLSGALACVGCIIVLPLIIVDLMSMAGIVYVGTCSSCQSGPEFHSDCVKSLMSEDGEKKRATQRDDTAYAHEHEERRLEEFSQEAEEEEPPQEKISPEDADKFCSQAEDFVKMGPGGFVEIFLFLSIALICIYALGCGVAACGYFGAEKDNGGLLKAFIFFTFMNAYSTFRMVTRKPSLPTALIMCLNGAAAYYGYMLLKVKNQMEAGSALLGPGGVQYGQRGPQPGQPSNAAQAQAFHGVQYGQRGPQPGQPRNAAQAQAARTTTSSPVAAGSTSLPVVSATGFVLGDTIMISDGSNSEENIIAGWISGFGSIRLATPLVRWYNAGAQVWVQARN